MKNLASLLIFYSILCSVVSVSTTSYNQYAHDATSAIFGIYSSLTPLTQNTDLLFDVNFAYTLTNPPELIYGINQYMQQGDISAISLKMTI